MALTERIFVSSGRRRSASTANLRKRDVAICLDPGLRRDDGFAGSSSSSNGEPASRLRMTIPFPLFPFPALEWGKGRGEGRQQTPAKATAPHPNPLPACGGRRARHAAQQQNAHGGRLAGGESPIAIQSSGRLAERESPCAMKKGTGRRSLALCRWIGDADRRRPVHVNSPPRPRPLRPASLV
jgi:hypothetical protein